MASLRKQVCENRLVDPTGYLKVERGNRMEGFKPVIRLDPAERLDLRSHAELCCFLA